MACNKSEIKMFNQENDIKQQWLQEEGACCQNPLRAACDRSTMKWADVAPLDGECSPSFLWGASVRFPPHMAADPLEVLLKSPFCVIKRLVYGR